jgi:hypothetical protein
VLLHHTSQEALADAAQCSLRRCHPLFNLLKNVSAPEKISSACTAGFDDLYQER